jgi:hypothetical protein
MVEVLGETSYRSGREIIKQAKPEEFGTIDRLLNGGNFELDTESPDERQRNISDQITDEFSAEGWQTEVKVKNMDGPKYDLFRNGVPIEVEIGHRRMVYADFFKFLADYSERHIPARDSMMNKLSAVEDNFFVPIWIIGIPP